MFYNMMTGNIQGYEDINSQRKFENNYKFNWDEDVIEDVEQKILEFSETETSATEPDVDSKLLFFASAFEKLENRRVCEKKAFRMYSVYGGDRS